MQGTIKSDDDIAFNVYSYVSLRRPGFFTPNPVQTQYPSSPSYFNLKKEDPILFKDVISSDISFCVNEPSTCVITIKYSVFKKLKNTGMNFIIERKFFEDTELSGGKNGKYNQIFYLQKTEFTDLVDDVEECKITMTNFRGAQMPTTYLMHNAYYNPGSGGWPETKPSYFNQIRYTNVSLKLVYDDIYKNNLFYPYTSTYGESPVNSFYGLHDYSKELRYHKKSLIWDFDAIDSENVSFATDKSYCDEFFNYLENYCKNLGYSYVPVFQERITNGTTGSSADKQIQVYYNAPNDRYLDASDKSECIVYNYKETLDVTKNINMSAIFSETTASTTNYYLISRELSDGVKNGRHSMKMSFVEEIKDYDDPLAWSNEGYSDARANLKENEDSTTKSFELQVFKYDYMKTLLPGDILFIANSPYETGGKKYVLKKLKEVFDNENNYITYIIEEMEEI